MKVIMLKLKHIDRLEADRLRLSLSLSLSCIRGQTHVASNLSIMLHLETISYFLTFFFIYFLLFLIF